MTVYVEKYFEFRDAASKSIWDNHDMRIYMIDNKLYIDRIENGKVVYSGNEPLRSIYGALFEKVRVGETFKSETVPTSYVRCIYSNTEEY